MIRHRHTALSGLFCFLFLPIAAWGARQSGETQPTISRITIRGTDIFDLDTNVALRKFPYTWINFLHIRTREDVIRQELLFKVGDQMDPYLLQETERNLRALSFIRAARIAKFPQRDGTVALVVHVNDAWTTEPQINLGGQNRIDTKEFGFKEKNLFGRGKTIGVFYKQGDDFTQREYTYTDPRLLGSRWQGKASLLNNTNEETKRASIERPFYSADTKFSTRASHENSKQRIEEFTNNVKSAEFQQNKQTNEFAVATKIGGGRDVVNHAGLRYRKTVRDFERNENTPAGQTLPTNDDLQTVFLDFDTQHNEFLEMTRLEKMTRVEDVNLGPSLRLSPGVSPYWLNGRPTSSEGEASFEGNVLLRKKHLLYSKYSYSGRSPFEQSENQRYLIQWKYYHRPSERQTLVVHTRADWGDKLDPDSQIKLGGQNGLRAFKNEGIVGTKGWVLNVEDRLFFIEELWNLFSIGAAVFYDTGYVWARNNPVALSQLRSSVGAGLRLGLTRSSNEVIIRVDCSYRTQVDKPGDSHLVISFGTGQAF